MPTLTSAAKFGFIWDIYFVGFAGIQVTHINVVSHLANIFCPPNICSDVAIQFSSGEKTVILRFPVNNSTEKFIKQCHIPVVSLSLSHTHSLSLFLLLFLYHSFCDCSARLLLFFFNCLENKSAKPRNKLTTPREIKWRKRAG